MMAICLRTDHDFMTDLDACAKYVSATVGDKDYNATFHCFIIEFQDMFTVFLTRNNLFEVL